MNEHLIDNFGNASAMSAGTMLAQERERQGLHKSDVAYQLKLTPTQLDALEQDKYDQLPGQVFVRGFIRNYAKLLQLDPEPLLNFVELKFSPPPPPPSLPAEQIEVTTTGGKSWLKYSGAIFSLALVGLLGWYVGFETPRTDYAPMPSAVRSTPSAVPNPPQLASAPAVQAPTAAPVPQEQVNTVAPTPETQIPEQGSIPSSVGTVAENSVNTEQVTTAAVNERTTVLLQFNADSWIEVKDKEGKRLLSKLAKHGSEETVEGDGPLSLVIGNADHVKLIHNGQPVNLAPYTSVNVARLHIP